MSTTPLSRFILAPPIYGVAALILAAFGAGCSAEPVTPSVQLAPAEPSSIEVGPERAILGAITLAEIEITADDVDAPDLRGESEADAVVSAESPQDSGAAWLKAMAASKQPVAARRAVVPASYGAMGGGVGLGAYEPGGELAPVHKSFATRSSRAPAEGVASVAPSGRGNPQPAVAANLSGRRPSGPAAQALDAETIKSGVRQQLGRVRACYERALKTEEQLSGRLVLAFQVQPDGGVGRAAVKTDELGSDKVAECVVTAVSNFRFPRGSDVVAVEYPMNFRPDGAW